MRYRGLLLCLLASPALAQDQLIPKELVDGLLSSRGVRQPVMFVGELPREMVGRIYVPKGARVLGGMSMGSSGTAVLLSNSRREQIIAEFETELPKIGWKQFDPSMRMNLISEFRDAAMPPGVVRMASTGPQQFCGATGGMIINVEPAGFADTRITITASDVNPCTGMNPQASAAQQAEYALRPKLINPPAARTDMSCLNIGRDNTNFSLSSGGFTALNTSMTSMALADHYAKQLADSGWTAVNQQRVVRAWTKPDSAGKPMRYEMTIEESASVPTCRRISTQLARSSR
jgi:hypothetical protein